MASTSGSKKGKKKKGQTVNLTDFLSGGTSGAPDGKTVVTFKKQTSWADTMEAEDEEEEFATSHQQIALPTAPRAARQEIDLSQLPDNPPFTAYVGNLSYDADETGIRGFFSKMTINVSSVRLPKDNGRMKGYGYVEFEDKQSLISALKADGETFLMRKIKVDLATQSNNRDSGFGNDHGRSGSHQIRSEGDADDDWRGSAAANKASFEPSSYGRSRDGDYGRGRDDRDGGFGSRRPYDDRYGTPRDRSGADSDSWERAPQRSGAGYEDRNGYGSRRGYDSTPRRGYDDYGPPRRGYDDYGPPRRGYDDRDSGYGRREGRSDGYDRQSNTETPRERPKLQLKPRSEPLSSDNKPASTSSSVFGGAKPVDTAAREREIEAKLSKEKAGDVRDPKDHHRDTKDSGSSFSSRDIRTNVERKVYYSKNTPNSSPSSNQENDHPDERSTPEPVKKPSSASIFGSAKPVDTAAREREIEERLRKEKATSAVAADVHDKAEGSGSDRRHSGGGARDQHGEISRDSHRGGSYSRGGVSKGAGPDSGRGGGGRPHHRERRERPLPKSIDEMPVYKETESRDFSDKNKYAGLLGADGDDDVAED